jgi:hypothetical protein
MNKKLQIYIILSGGGGHSIFLYYIEMYIAYIAYLYIYINIYIYIYMYIHVRIYIHIYTHTCIPYYKFRIILLHVY